MIRRVVVATLYSVPEFGELLLGDDDTLRRWYEIRLDHCIRCGCDLSDHVDRVAGAYVVATCADAQVRGLCGACAERLLPWSPENAHEFGWVSVLAFDPSVERSRH